MNSPQRKFPTTFQKKTENNVLKDHYDPPMCLLMLHMIGNTRIIGQEENPQSLEMGGMDFDLCEH